LDNFPSSSTRIEKPPGEKLPKPGNGVFCRGLVSAAVAAYAVIFSAADVSLQEKVQRVPRQDAAAVIKLVPVRALDSAGRPVRGLKKEDFVIYDNDEIKTITEFEAYVSGLPDMTAGEEAVEAMKLQPETQRKYFFVLDTQGSDLFGHRDAKKAVLEFAETRLKPGDEASVLTFGAMSGLVIKQYLTSDLEKIRQAIKRSLEIGAGGEGGGVAVGRVSGAELEEGQERALAERPESAGRGREGAGEEGRLASGTGMVVPGRQSSETPFGLGKIQVEVPGLGSAARNKADFDLSMAELAKAMRYVPGSKSVVYFSMRTPGKDVGRLFAESNTTIYAVNTNSAPPKGGGPGAGQRRELKNRQGEALKAFAEASGGHYFANVADAKTIAEDVAVLSGNYYVLGYYISPSWDGRLHRIKVEVKQPGIRLLVQEGYNDPKPFAKRSDLEKKLQLYDLVLSDKTVATDALNLASQVYIGVATKEANIAVLLRLTVDEVIGVPPGKTEIYTFIFDKDHKIVLGEHGEMDTSLYPQKTFFPYLLANLLPGEYECRVVARDLETGQAAASRLSFGIPQLSASGITLSSPLLLLPGKPPEFVQMSRPQKKEKEPLSIIRFYPFLPRDCVPILESLSPRAQKIWALLSLRVGIEMPAELELEVKLVQRDGGEAIPIEWRVLDTGTGEAETDFVLFDILLPDLEPGVYFLEFTAVDATTGSQALAKAPLHIR
jgi:VWFA-related protein